jgi:hypothetical protein
MPTTKTNQKEGQGTRLHFAGLNSAQWAEVLEGRDVLVSYADVLRRRGVWEREIRPRLEAGLYRSAILDSGAFTELAERRAAAKRIAEERGVGLEELTSAELERARVEGFERFHVDLETYAAFAVEVADLFDFTVNLDDIEGDVARSSRNQAALEAAGLDPVPVFHQGEPWEILEELLENHARIGVGFQRPIRNGRAFLEAFFARVGGRAQVHGFGMTRWADEFPFATTDSTTWIAEYRAIRKRTPGETFEGTHGVGGAVAERLERFSDAELAELVLDSYRDAGAEKIHPADELVELDDQVDRESRGQARTVFHRYGAARLLEKLGAMERPAEEGRRQAA